MTVGPTGSGKTTTLHSILANINIPERKIWTAEDPVEISQPGLQQVQINPKIDFTFAAALRAFLRADPDVIMIGEMRDIETVSIAIQASLTGHLVFSTLHTNSEPETVTRLLDMNVDPINFSDALLGILAQRLIRTLCEDCKQAYMPDNHELQKIMLFYGDDELFNQLNEVSDKLQIYRPVGCSYCGKTGYKGRIAVHELLASSPELSDLIYARASAAEIRKLGSTQGMNTLIQDAIVKLLNGKTGFDQIARLYVPERTVSFKGRIVPINTNNMKSNRHYVQASASVQ